jgi:hypothetical protein
MVCPVCVVGGVGFILSRVFGFPDIIVAFVTGMMATSMAYWGNHLLTKKWKKIKGQLVAIKGQLVVINILSGIVCLYSLKLIGLW